VNPTIACDDRRVIEMSALKRPPGGVAVFQLGRAAPGAPTVLAAHGITSSSRVWVPAARALAGRATLIAFDLRGRGASSRVGEPYGIKAHVADMLSILDALELERALLAGHSLGAYVAAMLASEHAERADGVLLVDGGLKIPGSENVDPQQFANALLGPTLERLSLSFDSREAYRDWWRAHPALAGGQISDEDLIAYADHDLRADGPPFRCSVSERAVRADAQELFPLGATAERLELPARLLCAERGLRNEPPPMHPWELAREWVDARPGQRDATLVEDSNHYTVAMGPRGALTVASAILELASKRSSGTRA
jgi:pimeloyl-ACP methyl ester carboxylesterase